MKEPIFSPLQEPYSSETLPNGLKVSVFQKPGFGNFCAVLAVRFGRGDLRYTLDGHSRQLPLHIAFLMGQFLIHQAHAVLRERVAFSDADMDAYVTEDQTFFRLTCRKHFEECLSLLLKTVTEPQFTQEKLDRAKVGAIQRRDAMKKNSFQQLKWQLQQGLYGTQPPFEDNFDGITVETIECVHRAFYRPSNLALCVAGDVDPVCIFRLALTNVPSDDRKKLHHEAAVSEENSAGGREKAIAMDVQETSFLLGFHTALGNSVRQKLLGALAIETFAGESSPLCKRLHREHLLSSQISAELHASSRKTYITFYGCSFVSTRVAEEIMSEAIRISWQGLDSVDFIRAKRVIYGKEIMKVDDFRNLCTLQTEKLLFDLQWMQFPEILSNITKSDVEEMLRECIADEQSFLSIVYPKGVY